MHTQNAFLLLFQADGSQAYGAVLSADGDELYVSGHTKGVLPDYDGDGEHGVICGTSNGGRGDSSRGSSSCCSNNGSGSGRAVGPV